MCSWGCLGLPSTIKETKITKQSNSSRLLLKRLANKQWLKQDKCCNTVFLLISSVQSLSSVWLFVTPWTAARQASLSITNPEFTQTHVHQVGDAIQPFHPLSSPSPPALNLSHHQGLFKWVSSSHQVAQVLEFQLQHQSFQWTPRTDFL